MANDNTPNGTTPEPKKLSAYKQRLQEKGLDQFVVEAPIELVDMLRKAAKDADDQSVASWVRFQLATALNNLNMTHEVVDPASGKTVTQPWTFDLKKLEESKARTSTANLSPEEKKAVKEKKAAEQKEERELIKRLLAEHRAKLAAAMGKS